MAPVITTFKEWEENIAEKHVAFFVENNRMYHAFDERLQMCRNNAPFVAYIFTPNYERLVGIPDHIAAELFAKSRDTKEQVLEKRRDADVDLIFIPDPDEVLPYQEHTLPEAKKLITEIPYKKDMDWHSYLRATYGVSYYMAHFWAEPVNYIALCPYAMLYNLCTKEMLRLLGVDAGVPTDLRGDYDVGM